MSDKTKTEWTDATWNPVTGCTKVSPGCDHCYAERVTERFQGKGSFANVALHPDRLDQPLRWKRPRKVFVNSMSDLFHDQIPDSFIVEVFAVMALAPRHTFQILTKRHGRMRALLRRSEFEYRVSVHFDGMAGIAQRRRILRGDDVTGSDIMEWPLPNVWLGVSVEDQKWADIRIPALLDTPATVRFLSCEPLLGPIDLMYHFGCPHETFCSEGCTSPTSNIDWCIVGGESGPGARPMHPDWARSLRDQCVAAGVPFLFKQWGEWFPGEQPGVQRSLVSVDGTSSTLQMDEHVRYFHRAGDDVIMQRLGKKAAGRELDGRTWDEYPAVTA